jgi:hypothetical protein
VNVPALAVKVALLDPEATVTDVGTVMAVVLELRLTLTPPEPAAPLRLTVQTLELPGPRELGVHARPVTVNADAATEIEPPVAVTETPSPASDAPNALVSPIVVAPVAADMVTETVATTPFAITLLLIPVATQT